MLLYNMTLQECAEYSSILAIVARNLVLRKFSTIFNIFFCTESISHYSKQIFFPYEIFFGLVKFFTARVKKQVICLTFYTCLIGPSF